MLRLKLTRARFAAGLVAATALACLPNFAAAQSGDPIKIGFIGFVVISKVPNTLHTPLMSGTNAIHGIVLLGGLLLLGLPGLDGLSKALLVIAVAFGTINVIGGFLVTDRMLEMFKVKPKSKASDGEGGGAEGSDQKPGGQS